MTVEEKNAEEERQHAPPERVDHDVEQLGHEEEHRLAGYTRVLSVPTLILGALRGAAVRFVAVVLPVIGPSRSTR